MNSRNQVLLLLLSVAPLLSGQAQTQYATDVSGGVMLPSASFGTYFKTGIALNLAFAMKSGDGLRYHLALGYHRAALDNQALNDDPNSNPGGGQYDLRGAVASFPILIGFRLMSPKPEVRPYGILEAGVHLYTKKFDGGTYTYSNGTIIQVPSKSTFKVEPAVNFGVGVMIPLDAKKSLDLALRYYIVKNSSEPQIPGDEFIAASQYFTLTAGFSWSFVAP